jgi:hypothetical protein
MKGEGLAPDSLDLLASLFTRRGLASAVMLKSASVRESRYPPATVTPIVSPAAFRVSDGCGLPKDHSFL